MAYADDEFPVNLGGQTPDTISGILQGAAAPSARQGASLGLLTTPNEIASIPGLADFAYSGNGGLGNYADQRVQKDVGGQQRGAGYVPTFDQVSLAPQNWNSPGLDFSNTGGQPGSSAEADKLELGSKAADYFNTAADFWNGQNKILGLHFGPEGPEMLERYSKPVQGVLGSAAEVLGAGADIAKWASTVPTLSGGIIKGESRLGGVALGAEGLGTLGELSFGHPGGVIGGVIGGLAGGMAPDFMYRNMSRQQIGEKAARLYGMGADVDPRTFMP